MSKVKKLSDIDVTINGKTIDTEKLDSILNPGADDFDTPKALEIKSAKLKDDFCNYGYEFKTGPAAGDVVPNRNGASIVHNDLKLLFKKLNVHLAVKCEEVNRADIGDVEVLEKIDFMVEQEEGTIEHRIAHFTVSSFRLEGNGENEGVVLMGTKRLSTGELVSLTSPKILWFSEYLFVNELRVVISDLQNEVELYMNGKTAPKLVQKEMEFGGDDKDQNQEE